MPVAACEVIAVITLSIDYEKLSICAEEMYRALRLDSCWCHEVVKVVDKRNKRIAVKCSRCQAIERYEALLSASLVLSPSHSAEEAPTG